MGKPALSFEIATSVSQLEAWRAKSSGRTVGFVPTMGALHDGHMALVDAARKTCDQVLVSIFVNPLQFGPNEDFGKYPRSLEQDFQICQKFGVDAVFHPSIDIIYPQGETETTTVQPPAQLISRLCGAFRPGHFVGVATVVNKLFNIVRPDCAFFGEKDYQQLQVIRHMVDDLNMNVKIIGVPTMREEDGLALSSRNVYLSEAQRRLAPKLFAALSQAKMSILSGTAISAAVSTAKSSLASLDDVTVQYIECCDPRTLQAVSDRESPCLMLVAAKYGDVRLIDNLVVNP